MIFIAKQRKKKSLVLTSDKTKTFFKSNKKRTFAFEAKKPKPIHPFDLNWDLNKPYLSQKEQFDLNGLNWEIHDLDGNVIESSHKKKSHFKIKRVSTLVHD